MLKLLAAWGFIIVLTAALFFKIITPAPVASQTEFDFSAVQIAIENQFETVDHLSFDDFVAMNKDSLLIFDTRPQNEFAVSHIEKAVQLDPEITAEKFAQIYGKAAADKTLVFYCSVGMRSSSVAERVAREFKAAGPIYNLRGGIFEWHNEGRPLMKDGAPADYVHPYNKTWGKLVTRQDKLSYN